MFALMKMAYKEKYPVGTVVEIGAVERLKAFQRPQWKYHNPISDEQIESAGKLDKIKSVGFYHGGDVLYQLWSEPGTWHEACLEPPSSSAETKACCAKLARGL
jgi:hypothetical protein